MKIVTTTKNIIFENEKPTLIETLVDAINAGIKDFENVDLSYQNLTGLEVSEINLGGAYFKGAKIHNCKFERCQFDRTYFSHSEFINCNLSESRFINSYFSNASFESCLFRKARFEMFQVVQFEAVIFTNSDMTGAQIYNMTFSKSNFDGVLMNQVALHTLYFKECYLTGLSIESGILLSVLISQCHGDMTCNNCILEDSVIPESSNDKPLEFLSIPLTIKPENKRTIYRFNYGELSPYLTKSVWDYSAKAVRTKSIRGIYGYFTDTPDRLSMLGNQIFSMFLDDDHLLPENMRILKLEVDECDILYSGDEVAFTQGNIIEVIDVKDFISQNYPQYQKVLEFPKQKSKQRSDYIKKVFFDHFKTHECGHAIKPSRNNPSNDYVLLVEKLNLFKKYIPSNGKDSEIHGINHSKNVERNCKILARVTGANTRVIIAFAHLHDCCRLNDGADPDHGLRCSEMIKKYSDPILRDVLSDTERETLCFAIENHTRMLRTGNHTIDTCWDGDRLELNRVGITPKAELMATQAGAYFANNPDKFNELIDADVYSENL